MYIVILDRTGYKQEGIPNPAQTAGKLRSRLQPHGITDPDQAAGKSRSVAFRGFFPDRNFIISLPLQNGVFLHVEKVQLLNSSGNDGYGIALRCLRLSFTFLPAPSDFHGCWLYLPGSFLPVPRSHRLRNGKTGPLSRSPVVAPDFRHRLLF